MVKYVGGKTDCKCGEDHLLVVIIDDDGDIHGECLNCDEYVEMVELEEG